MEADLRLLLAQVRMFEGVKINELDVVQVEDQNPDVEK